MAEEKQAAEGEAKPEAEATEAPAKKGKGMLFLVVGLVVLVAGGGGGWWFFVHRPHAAATEGDAEAKEGEHPHEKEGPGAVEALDPFIANLADEDGRRYLKATLQFEFFDREIPNEFRERTAQVRDVILTLLTSKTFAEIRSPQGKALLREEIINRTNHITHRDIVKSVYFTEFIVQ